VKKYLIDVNLPRYFSLWSSNKYEHVVNINDEMKDIEIWHYARVNKLTIVTKDADFSELMLLNAPPPRVIHIKYGNMTMQGFHKKLSKTWHDICSLSNTYKLVNVYGNHIEGID